MCWLREEISRDSFHYRENTDSLDLEHETLVWFVLRVFRHKSTVKAI